MVSIYVKLSHEAALALHDLANNEHRDPKQQASFLIEKELERRGLLILEDPKTKEQAAAGNGTN